MKYLLDTCVISELKKTKFNPNVAATGIVNDCIVVTRNVADMVESGCKIFNPWE